MEGEREAIGDVTLEATDDGGPAVEGSSPNIISSQEGVWGVCVSLSLSFLSGWGMDHDDFKLKRLS
jgi:hypothetical protein